MRTFAHTRTYVFWDLVDFPVHEDEIDSFYWNVKSSLRNEGYYGEMSITAYGSRYARLNKILVDMVDYTRFDPQANLMLIIKRMPEEDTEVVSIIKEVAKRNYNLLLVVGDEDEDKCAYPSEVLSSFTVHPGIPLLRRSSRYARLNKILVEMVKYATPMDPQANFMLIIKGMAEKEDTEFVRIIKEVNKRNYNVLLVVGDEDEDKYPSEVLSSFTVWRWTSLVSGGSPIPPTTSEDDDDSDDEGSSPKRHKIIDASSVGGTMFS